MSGDERLFVIQHQAGWDAYQMCEKLIDVSLVPDLRTELER